MKHAVRCRYLLKRRNNRVRWGKWGEQRFVIAGYPPIEGAVAYPFEGKQQG